MTLKEYVKHSIDSNFKGELPFVYNEKRVKKNYVFIDYEETEKKIYYLKTGIVFVEIEYNSNGKILDFFFENSFFASYSSLLLRKPSDVRITAFSDCVVEVVDYEELTKSYETSLIANKLGRIETEKLYARKVKREKELLTKTAEQRYMSLLSEYPQIVQKIPIKDISMYLGIRPESLSRIRKNLIY